MLTPYALQYVSSPNPLSRTHGESLLQVYRKWAYQKRGERLFCFVYRKGLRVCGVARVSSPLPPNNSAYDDTSALQYRAGLE